MITSLLRPITRPRFFIPSRIALVALALGGSAMLWNPALRAAEDVAVSAEVHAGDNNSYRLFYEKLSDEGDWLQTDQYGYVFQPKVAVDDRAWRPYTDGYWAQTDAGWTWVSNENFGWAAYHYGRWANIVDTGWVWVPGSEWSPAYVSWRVSKDHKRVGWAPLPPEARLSRGQAIEAWADNAYDIGPEAYVFIDTNHFGETSYRSHLVPVEQNVTIITETENVTRTNYRTVESREVVYNGGPDVAIIREASGRPVRQMHLEMRAEKADFFQREDYRGITSVNGDRLVIATAAPEVITSTSIRVSQPARVRQRLTSVSVDRGYRGIGDPQRIESVRATLRSQSPPPPAQIEREVSAFIRRSSAVPLPNASDPNGRTERRGENAAAGAMDRRGEAGAAAGAMDRRGESAAPPVGSAASPASSPVDAAASPAPANRRDQRVGRNAAEPSPAAADSSPASSPAANAAASPAASPATGASPASDRRGARTRAGASPAAEPGASPAARSSSPAATPKPRANAEPETSPEPRRSGENRGERQQQPGATSRGESQSSATPASERRDRASSAERDAAPAVAPRREADSPREARPKSEAATARPNAEEPAQRREKPAARGDDEKSEKKTQAPAAEGAPSRRNSSESRGEERASGGGNAQGHQDKKEKAEPAAGEKPKTSPQ
jgi:hypothetical protein